MALDQIRANWQAAENFPHFEVVLGYVSNGHTSIGECLAEIDRLETLIDGAPLQEALDNLAAANAQIAQLQSDLEAANAQYQALVDALNALPLGGGGGGK